MEFQAGDDAVHPGYGVGTIVRREERQFAGIAAQTYYVLAIGTSIIWVPVQADGSTILRAVTPRRELDQYRRVLQGRPAALQRDHLKRRLEVQARLRPGSFQGVCEVVRDLTALGWNRPIGESDATLLQRARDNLRREWAVAGGLSLPEAGHEIDTLLRDSRSVYKTAEAANRS